MHWLVLNVASEFFNNHLSANSNCLFHTTGYKQKDAKHQPPPTHPQDNEECRQENLCSVDRQRCAQRTSRGKHQVPSLERNLAAEAAAQPPSRGRLTICQAGPQGIEWGELGSLRGSWSPAKFRLNLKGTRGLENISN